MEKSIDSKYKMPTEPAWSRDLLSNTTVCTWFYVLALVNLIFAIAGVAGAVFMAKKVSMVPLLVAGVVGFTNSWFMFLVCNRGLKG